jgi:hypothetical protein
MDHERFCFFFGRSCLRNCLHVRLFIAAPDCQPMNLRSSTSNLDPLLIALTPRPSILTHLPTILALPPPSLAHSEHFDARVLFKVNQLVRSSRRLSPGMIVGIAIGSLMAAATTVLCCVLLRRRKFRTHLVRQKSLRTQGTAGSNMSVIEMPIAELGEGYWVCSLCVRHLSANDCSSDACTLAHS